MSSLRGLVLLPLIICLGLWPNSARAAKPQKLRVYLDWYPDVEFTGMYVALKNGKYKEAGIDLEMVFEGLDIIPSVINGKADIGMHSAHDLIRWTSKNKGLKAFSAQYQLNPNSIVVGKDSNISSVKDLKGKTLGIFSSQEYDMYRIMLGFHGLKLGDVKFKKIKTFKEAEIVKLMQSKVIDAVIAWEFNWTITFPLLGYEVRVFPGYDNGFHFYGIVFFAPENFIKKNTELLAKFLKITYDGWRDAYKDPEYFANFVVENHIAKERYINGSKEITQKQQFLELTLRQRYFLEGVGEAGIGRMSRFKWEKSLDISKRYGLVPKNSSLRAEDLYDDSVMDLVLGNKP